MEVARRLPSRSRSASRRSRSPTRDLVLLAVARPLGAEQAAEVEDALGSPFRQALASRAGLDQLIQRVHAPLRGGLHPALMETRPEESPRHRHPAARRPAW